MARKTSGPSGHTGQTSSGNVKDVKVDRIGPVTIYKHGLSYFLYFREAGKSCRRKVDGNLAVARVTATQVAAALAQNRPAPFGHERTAPDQMVGEYLRTITEVRKLAIRTQDRYRAALERFVEYCRDAGIVTLDSVTEATVEDFVRWLRGQTRTRNGARKGKREVYRTGGIRFILSTCCTAFNWAGRRRMLPPYADNPFARFPIEQLRDRDEADTQARSLHPGARKGFLRGLRRLAARNLRHAGDVWAAHRRTDPPPGGRRRLQGRHDHDPEQARTPLEREDGASTYASLDSSDPFPAGAGHRRSQGGLCLSE